MLIILIILILILIFLRSPLVKKGISIVNNEDNLENGYKNEPYEYDGGPNGLLRLLNDISSADKVILENITSKHILNKDIIDEELNIQVLDIIKKIINSINGISDYLFYVDSIENMYVMRDDDGNYRSILNCIIYEVKNFYTIRLTMDFVVFDTNMERSAALSLFGEILKNIAKLNALVSLFQKVCVQNFGSNFLTQNLTLPIEFSLK